MFTTALTLQAVAYVRGGVSDNGFPKRCNSGKMHKTKFWINRSLKKGIYGCL